MLLQLVAGIDYLNRARHQILCLGSIDAECQWIQERPADQQCERLQA